MGQCIVVNAEVLTLFIAVVQACCIRFERWPTSSKIMSEDEWKSKMYDDDTISAGRKEPSRTKSNCIISPLGDWVSHVVQRVSLLPLNIDSLTSRAWSEAMFSPTKIKIPAHLCCSKLTYRPTAELQYCRSHRDLQI
jgi:hypothetical protein